MKKAAVTAARECLDRAKAALTAMEGADSLGKMEQAWTDFLTMSNRVYVKLEQGAKNGKSQVWFGRKRGERRKDPLLRYIKNARDADEHGLDRVTTRRSHGVGIGATKPVHLTVPMIIENTEAGSKVSFPDGPPPDGLVVNFYPPSVGLVEVTNRGVKYQPPGDTNPISVSKKAIAYLDALIAEADALP